MVALYRRWLVGPSVTASLFTRCGCSNDILCACCMGPPAVIEYWLLLAHLCMGSTFRLADSGAQPSTQCAGCCAMLITPSGFTSATMVLPTPSCGYAACEAFWTLLCCCLKLASEWIGSRLIWRDSGAGQIRCCLWLALNNCLELSAIHSLWLPLLDLDACGKNQSMHPEICL